MSNNSNVICKINLIKSDAIQNNNKFWSGTLFANNDVLCEWGRIGDAGQSKLFSNAGRSFLDKKVAEKKRGKSDEIPYREIEIIDEKTVVVSSSKNDFKQIAKTQIRYNNPIVASLIEYFTKVNAHDISEATGGKIIYNFDSGSFKTPLGLVTQSTIDSARNKLSEIYDLVTVNDFSKGLTELTNDYFMLIPQIVPRTGLNVQSFWNEANIVQKQNSILDGLQSSLVNAKPVVEDKKEEDKKVFDTDLELETDQKIIDQIFANYLDKRSKEHSTSYEYKPISLWKVNIAPMKKAYDNVGIKMSNQLEGYHGTGAENMLSLLKTGFLVRPPKNAAIAGKMFGNGTYTAPCHIKGAPTKSLNYSLGYWTGKRSGQRVFMFICDVAMGKFYIPDKDITSLPSGYDSCWAKKGHTRGWHGPLLNDECVVYKENQINIKYLLELKNK